MKGRETGRRYEATHPWIRFRWGFGEASRQVWVLLGQVVARAELLATALIPPAISREMHRMWFVRGARATAAIEGNTLTEEEVEARRRGRRDLPPSRAYLGVEVDNVLDVCNGVREELIEGKARPLSRERLEAWNRGLLRGLEDHLAEGAVPGVVRKHFVVVGRYRGAPPEDCGFLLDRLCGWLEERSDGSSEPEEAGERVAQGILRGILAHLYLAWIHPFGDGNGRLARLAELFFLMRAGVPVPACHLPSNHYHRTRDEYYRQLDRASRARQGRGDPWGFVVYALEGLLDGLREQARWVERAQFRIAWPGFVLERLGGRPTEARERRLALAIALGLLDGRAAPSALRGHPALARFYAGRTSKTLTRDLNWLIARDLAERLGRGYRARTERLRTLAPGRVGGADGGTGT